MEDRLINSFPTLLERFDSSYPLSETVSILSGGQTDFRNVVNDVSEFDDFLNQIGQELRYIGLFTVELKTGTPVLKICNLVNDEWVWNENGGNSVTGSNGVTFTPHVSTDGTLTWTNDGGLTNPDPVNIKGPQGETGANGEDGKQIELTKDDTYIKWRYVGDASWTNLVAIADLQVTTGGGTTSYTLPPAKTNVLGGVMPDGTTITVDANGKISASVDQSTLQTLVNAYMAEHPVSATVGDGSITKESLDEELRASTFGFSLTLDEIPFNDASYDANGNYVAQWTTMKNSDLINLEIFELKHLHVYGLANVPILLFYDEYKSIIKGSNINATNNTVAVEFSSVTIPENAKYVRVCLQFSKLADSSVVFKCRPSIISSFDKGNYFESEENLDVSLFTNIGNYVYKEYATEFDSSLTYMATTDLRIVDFSIISFYIQGNSNATAVIYFDANKEAIGYTPYTVNAKELVTSESPEDACYYAVGVNIASVTAATTLNVSKKLSKFKINMYVKDCLESRVKNKNYLDYSQFQFMSSVIGKNQKVLCLGDSLTAGQYGNGTTYGQVLADKTGWDVTVSGYPGYRTTSLWGIIQNGKISTWEDKVFDMIIFFMGTNYGVGASMMTDPTANIPTIPEGGSYTDLGNGYDECYMKCIYQLQEWYPNATIFCVNIPKYKTGNGITYNKENIRLKYIVDNVFGLPLIDIRNYNLAALAYDSVYRVEDGVHWNNVGYSMVADFFYNEILKYYFYNPTKFISLEEPSAE